MPRPAGVTILAILAIVGGASVALLGLLVIAGAAFIASLDFTGMPLLAGIGAVGGVLLILFGAIYIVVGVGLLKLANWARLMTMALAATSLVFAFLAGGLVYFPFWAFALRRFITAAIDVLILWYLSQPRIKQAFSPVSSAAPTI